MMLERTPFLSREVMDALRVEGSSISPAKQVELRSEALRLTGKFMDLYGAFMSDDVRDRAVGLEDRILVTNNTRLMEFKSHWDPKLRHRSEFSPKEYQTNGTYLPTGELIVLNDQDRLTKLFPKEKAKSYIAKAGATRVKAVMDNFKWNATRSTLLHEIVHVFGKSIFPPLLSEAGARYYERELIRAAGYEEKELEEQFNTLCDLYSYLVNGLGDRAHRLFFGSEQLTQDDAKYIIGAINVFLTRSNPKI